MQQARKPAKPNRRNKTEPAIETWPPRLQEGKQQMVPVQFPQSNELQQPRMPQYVIANGAIRQSRIKDRPESQDSRDSSVKVKIELDLEAEVDLYARVKGDVTIGLM